ncbi:hypothetical protein V5799_011224 [Amblyomma americanum]|uniref:Uncharacterized protein n=1 Tax=Amblyomma americanum TaxID=6943 RepID=A0AAQ4EII0_AMBAM
MEGLRSSVVGDVRPLLAPQERQELVVTAEGIYQVTLKPYTMTIALYRMETPLAIKYAGLYFLKIFPLSSMFFCDDAFGPSRARSDDFLSDCCSSFLSTSRWRRVRWR